MKNIEKFEKLIVTSENNSVEIHVPMPRDGHIVNKWNESFLVKFIMQCFDLVWLSDVYYLLHNKDPEFSKINGMFQDYSQIYFRMDLYFLDHLSSIAGNLETPLSVTHHNLINLNIYDPSEPKFMEPFSFEFADFLYSIIMKYGETDAEFRLCKMVIIIKFIE